MVWGFLFFFNEKTELSWSGDVRRVCLNHVNFVNDRQLICMYRWENLLKWDIILQKDKVSCWKEVGNLASGEVKLLESMCTVLNSTPVYLSGIFSSQIHQ